jgi:CubicO group peptidase (beta-lactamase class C family)
MGGIGIQDPLRRIRIPRDLESITVRGPEEDPGSVGLTTDRVERMWESALALYRTRTHPTVQVCLRREGKVVLDRAIGHATGNGPLDRRSTPKVAATTETPICIYSASKGVTAILVHRLAERGVLDIDDPVVDYIPEYGRHGKEAITIGHVLAHRAGVARLPSTAFDLDLLGDRAFLLETICDAKPTNPAGKRLAYHAVTGGFILGEVVHRVTGRSIRDVLREELLDPLGFRWTNYGVAPGDVDAVATNYATGPALFPPISTIMARALGIEFERVVELSNDRRFLEGVLPAANVVTTANELSRFFEVWRAGGELDGVRLFTPDTIRRALTEQSRFELDQSLGFPSRFGYGLWLGDVLSLYGPDTTKAFGHLGLSNIVGWADPERAISAALLTTGKPVIYPGVHRFLGVMARFTRESPKVPPEQRRL